MKDAKGFTLIEMVVVLIITAVLAGVIVPLGFRHLEVKREDATKEEMVELHRAIVGYPKLGNFRYVGDMGALPSSLDDLVTNPGSTAYGTQTNGVLMGWNGPYINMGEDSDDYKTDAWGTAYDYGVVGTGQIRSYGPDKTAGGVDDIIYPPRPVTLTGSVSLTVYSNAQDKIPNRAPTGGSLVVTFYYSNNGEEASDPKTNYDTSTDSFLFKTGISPNANTHPGTHAVKVEQKDSEGVVEETVLLNVDIPLIGAIHEDIFLR